MPDPDGEWIADPTDPRALVKADRKKGEHGLWKLFPEGRDSDKDERAGEDAEHDTIVNRNFPEGWQEHRAEFGTFATDEPEARALCEFVLAHRDVAAPRGPERERRPGRQRVFLISVVDAEGGHDVGAFEPGIALCLVERPGPGGGRGSGVGGGRIERGHPAQEARISVRAQVPFGEVVRSGNRRMRRARVSGRRSARRMTIR